MNPAEVSAVLVTRGNVDISEILDSIAAAGIKEVCVWDNSTEEDLSVYGRYAAIERAKYEICYVQDDDCVVPIGRLLAVASQYDLTEKLVCNMPRSRWADYPDSALIGWGAVFQRHLPTLAFDRFNFESPPIPAEEVTDGGESLRRRFYRECDMVFTALTPCVKVDLGFEHLPWAEDPARALFKQPGHKQARDRMLALARQVRDS